MLSPLQVYTRKMCMDKFVSLTRPVPNHEVTYDATPPQFHFSHIVSMLFNEYHRSEAGHNNH